MLNTKTRLLEAQRALHSLELQIEQYGIHISELSAHAGEVERARAVLGKLLADLGAQRTYCDLLAKSGRNVELPVNKGSRVA
jgi:hypothetical protein